MYLGIVRYSHDEQQKGNVYMARQLEPLGGFYLFIPYRWDGEVFLYP